jgi:DNA-binding protein HU-beta
MNKTELVAKLAQRTGLTQAKTAELVNAIFDGNNGLIAEELASGGKVTLPGFGTWSVRERPARVGANPKTGAKMNISARKATGFKAGLVLKNKIRG